MGPGALLHQGNRAKLPARWPFEEGIYTPRKKVRHSHTSIRSKSQTQKRRNILCTQRFILEGQRDIDGNSYRDGSCKMEFRQGQGNGSFRGAKRRSNKAQSVPILEGK